MGREIECEVYRQERKKKIILIIVCICILLSVILGIFVKGYVSATKKYKDQISELETEIKRLNDPVVKHDIASREVSIDLIKAEIKNIGELATVEYLYTDAGKFEDAAQLFGKDIPFSFTTKSFIAKWDGIIKAGINVDDIIVEINDVNREIIIHIPKAKILSHEIDESSVETLDEKDGLFNEVKVEDVREFDAVSKEAMEARAIENGILDKAYESAKQIIESLINNDVVQEQGYSIKFEMIE